MGIVIARSRYIIDGILNFEKNGKSEKKGLYKIEKKDPNPVRTIRPVITQKINSNFFGFLKVIPKIENIKITRPT